VLEDFSVVTWNKEEAPNASYESLVGVLNNLPNHEESIKFAYLKDLQEDPHYGFKVAMDGVTAPCAAYAVVLIESMQPSATTACGDGFKITTEGIIDIAGKSHGEDNDDANSTDFTVIGYGSMDEMVRLDPPRGKKSRVAVLLIDRVEGKTLYMQKAEYIEPSDVANAVRCFKRLRMLCKKINPIPDAKRGHMHATDFTENPQNMKKCKTLRAVPTDESMKD
jgi:hypothetical protein